MASHLIGAKSRGTGRARGLEVADIAAKLGGKPSVASIYRLEQGQAIRVAHARRVFDAVNVEGKLKPEVELKDET
jgi:hypothetical protein